MTIGDVNGTAHITADPIRARVSNKGARLMGLPGGYKLFGNFPRYDGPEPFAEVFDGIAIANSKHSELNAYLVDYSDGSVTVGWTADNETNIMRATFVSFITFFWTIGPTFNILCIMSILHGFICHAPWYSLI